MNSICMRNYMKMYCIVSKPINFLSKKSLERRTTCIEGFCKERMVLRTVETSKIMKWQRILIPL